MKTGQKINAVTSDAMKTKCLQTGESLMTICDEV